MEIKARVQINNLLFFSAFTLYIIRDLIGDSLYDYMLPGVWARLASVAVIAILVLKWLLDEEFTGRKLIIWLCVFSLLFIIAITNNYLNILVVFALIFSAQNIKFDDILKCIIFIFTIVTLFVICSWGVGILEDYTFEHSIAILVSTAHSLGFKYYSTLGFIAMSVTAIYLYLNRDCGYLQLIILTFLNTLFYFVHTTTLAIVFVYLIIAAYVVAVKWKLFKLKWKIWDYIAMLTPIGFFTFTVGAVLLFDNGVLSMDIPFLRTIVDRLEYSIQAIDEYGIHLFGSEVEMYGNTAADYGSAESAFYIDSGYMYILIAYGVIISLVIIILYMIVFHYVYLQHDAYVYLWLLCFLGICCINNFVVAISYNPLLFLLPKALFDIADEKSEVLKGNITDEPTKRQKKLCL